MTSRSQTAVRPAHLPATPAVILALVGLLDIGFLGVVGSSIARIVAAEGSLIVATIIALVLLRRRPRPQRV